MLCVAARAVATLCVAFPMPLHSVPRQSNPTRSPHRNPTPPAHNMPEPALQLITHPPIPILDSVTCVATTSPRSHILTPTTLPHPLPRRTILNMVLPKVMSKVFLASLPNELGKYVLESDEALIISGEFRMHGPELASFTADLSAALTPPPAVAPAAAAAALKKQASAAALGQLSPAHAHAAAQLAVGALGLSEAATAVLVELFSGRAAMMESQRPCSIAEVCKVYLAHSKSESWPEMCSLWDAACAAIMSQRGLAMEEPFSFSRFMQGEVGAAAAALAGCCGCECWCW